MTPPSNSKTGAPTAEPANSPASATSSPGSPLPEGWHRSGPDEIRNTAGYRIHKNHVYTHTGMHPLYHALMPNLGNLGSFPELPGAVAAVAQFQARTQG